MNDANSLLTTVSKSLDLIEAVAYSQEGLTITQIADVLERPKSSIFRYLATLEQRGYLERNPITQRYLLGMKFLQLGATYSQRWDLTNAATAVLLELRDQTLETVNLAMPRNNRVVYLQTIQSPQPVRVTEQLGLDSPMHATALGKVMLSLMPPQLVQIVLARQMERFTDSTITEPVKLLDELSRIREIGYAIDDCESSLEIRCVASPIQNRNGELVAAISISAPSYRFSLERAQKIGTVVFSAARKISSRLGFNPDTLQAPVTDQHDNDLLDVQRFGRQQKGNGSA